MLRQHVFFHGLILSLQSATCGLVLISVCASIHWVVRTYLPKAKCILCIEPKVHNPIKCMFKIKDLPFPQYSDFGTRIVWWDPRPGVGAAQPAEVGLRPPAAPRRRQILNLRRGLRHPGIEHYRLARVPTFTVQTRPTVKFTSSPVPQQLAALITFVHVHTEHRLSLK